MPCLYRVSTKNVATVCEKKDERRQTRQITLPPTTLLLRRLRHSIRPSTVSSGVEKKKKRSKGLLLRVKNFWLVFRVVFVSVSDDTGPSTPPPLRRPCVCGYCSCFVYRNHHSVSHLNTKRIPLKKNERKTNAGRREWGRAAQRTYMRACRLNPGQYPKLHEIQH